MIDNLTNLFLLIYYKKYKNKRLSGNIVKGAQFLGVCLF
jgi:hypothetical protein